MALCGPGARDACRRIVNLGLTGAFRARTPAPGHYSFWDYQAGAWDRNDGVRIDHVLLTPQAADRLDDCWIEAEMRGRPKPSDHVPVWVELDAGSEFEMNRAGLEDPELYELPLYILGLECGQHTVTVTGKSGWETQTTPVGVYLPCPVMPEGM